jgi:nitroreductase
MHILESLNWRYATKKFDKNREIPKDDLEKLLEAIRLSASSYGLQPYRVLVVKDDGLREKLRTASFGQAQVTDCSHYLIFCIERWVDASYIGSYLDKVADLRALERTQLTSYEGHMVEVLERKGTDERRMWKEKQAYIALGNAMTVGAFMGIDTCAMEGFDSQAYDEILDLNSLGIQSCVALALGYRHPEDGTQKLSKIRRAEDKFFIKM